MPKDKRFIFLSEKFYQDYPIDKYPEIEQKLKKYIEEYKKAKDNPDDRVCQTLLKYSTLQYFEEYLFSGNKSEL